MIRFAVAVHIVLCLLLITWLMLCEGTRQFRRTLLALVLTFVAFPALGVPDFVQGDQESSPSGTTHDLAFGSNVTDGSCLVSWYRVDSGVTVTGVSDNVNGAWSAGPSVVAFTGHDFFSFYELDVAAGATTVTGSTDMASAAHTIILEYDDCTQLIDSDSTGLASANPQTCSANTATAANQRQVGLIGHSSTVTFDPNSSETEREDTTRIQAQDKLTGGAGSITQSWSLSGAETVVCASLLFDSPAAVTGGSPFYGKFGGPLRGRF